MYSQEEVEFALEALEEFGSVAEAIRFCGYPGRKTLREWAKGKTPHPRRGRAHLGGTHPVYSQATRDAALAMVEAGAGFSEAARAAGVGCGYTVSRWAKKAGMEVTAMEGKRDADARGQAGGGGLPDDVDGLREMAEGLRAEVHRLKLEAAVWREAAELVKKDPGADPNRLTNREKATLVRALRDRFALGELLEAVHLARSSYFYQVNAMSAPDKYAALRGRVAELFRDSGRRYGYRRVHAALRLEGEAVSEKVVRRLMREGGLVAKGRRRRRGYSSYLGEISGAPENLVKRDFHADAPNRLWLTDITEFRIAAGKAYLSSVIDCFDGMAVGWRLSASPDARLANSSLEAACSGLREGEHPRIHSDRGCHYRWPGWLSICEERGLERSMSAKGCSPDNAACEGFFGRLKNEFFYGEDWDGWGLEEFMREVDRYMHWYNEERIKVSLGGLSPVQYRKALGLMAA